MSGVESDRLTALEDIPRPALIKAALTACRHAADPVERETFLQALGLKTYQGRDNQWGKTRTVTREGAL